MRTAAVLPIKSFSRAKQRLGGAVEAARRRELAEAMVGDVLAALARVEGLDLLVVVTAEPVAAAAAGEAGAIVAHDPVEAGQSAAAEIGIVAARERGAERLLLVPGDCPALDPEEVRGLLERHARLAAGGAGAEPAGGGRPAAGEGAEPAGGGRPAAGEGAEPAGGGRPAVLVVPDRHGAGTNALVLSPPDAVPPAFGPGSFARHAALARARGALVREGAAASLALDVDTSDDLRALAAALEGRPGAAPRTRALLARLAAVPAAP